MGDRTTCNLYLMGNLNSVSTKSIGALAKLIDELGAEDYGGGTPAEKLAAGDGHFWFDEVNWGEFDEILKSLIIESGLSYAWQWDAGGGYPSGIEFYNTDTKETETFGCLDSEICLGVSDLTPKKISSAQRWHKWFHKTNLEYTGGTK